ncbi:hypothetical protein GIB67_034900 [Kingdonia uniflora]|uniref:Uncharacterized protein n=1 Tax=Kingdonia uniflora TaxID=39325 RepID=A0A7J7NGI9_9MAGN|nr:hypothetical protein GIB67_034900 [Kingdonia uniflora]
MRLHQTDNEITSPNIYRRLFQSWYLDSGTNLFGERTVLIAHSFLHRFLKNMLLKVFGPENLKENLLPEIEETTRRYLKHWSSQPSVESKDGISMMIFDLTAKKLISCNEAKSFGKLKDNFTDVIKGVITFPLNIPGTAFYKCLQAKHSYI